MKAECRMQSEMTVVCIETMRERVGGVLRVTRGVVGIEKCLVCMCFMRLSYQVKGGKKRIYDYRL